MSEALKDQVKAERDACKKELQKLKEQFFEKDSAEIAEEIADCREPIGVLIDLTEQFAKAFAEKNGAKIFLIMPIWNTLRSKFLCSRRTAVWCGPMRRGSFRNSSAKS